MENIATNIWTFLWGLPLIPASKALASRWLTIGELGLIVFAFVVVVALVGEHKAEQREKKWIPEKRGRNWVTIWTWIVIVGIVGELFADADIWVSSDALQTISEGEIAALNAEIAPRRLKVAQQKALGAALHAFKGKTVAVKSYELDVEGAILGKQIAAAITLGEIKVFDEILTQSALGSVGMKVSVSGDDKDLVKMLLSALHSIGKIEVTDEVIPAGSGFSLMLPNAPSKVDATVFVGVKPIKP